MIESEKQQNESNLIYFECSSMRDLYDLMENWQKTNHKLFSSLNIQQDGENFCCIALISDSYYMKARLKYEEDIEKFQRKALKHIGAIVDFESKVIPINKISAIQMRLQKCKTPEEVKTVFKEEF